MDKTVYQFFIPGNHDTGYEESSYHILPALIILPAYNLDPYFRLSPVRVISPILGP